MKKLSRILAVFIVTGLLFLTGGFVADTSDNSESVTGSQGGVLSVYAHHCPQHEPGYPDNCPPIP